MNNNISDKDKKDWKNFIKIKKNYLIKILKLKKKIFKKKRSIDLHGYTLDEANKTIEKFIKKAYEDGINKLIVVTGKGYIQKMKKIHMFQKI